MPPPVSINEARFSRAVLALEAALRDLHSPWPWTRRRARSRAEAATEELHRFAVAHQLLTGPRLAEAIHEIDDRLRAGKGLGGEPIDLDEARRLFGSG